ncbi:MAG: hypothetical protein ACXWDL_01525 [Nocardioides sp.]
MRRTRHLVGPPLAAIALLALAACGTVETPSRDSAGPGQSGGNRVDAGAGSWTQLPDSPLSPRERPATAHVETGKGDLVVFIGGYIGRPCPPNADCSVPEDSTASDGASFNLDSGTWETIADAPRPVSSYAPTAVIGQTVYVLTGGTLLSWDVADDHWTELVPPANPGWSDLVADGDRLILASGSDENGVRPDQVYDTNTGAWTRLASDPLKPSFDRILVSTPSGLVLTAKPIAAAGGPEDPALVHAAVIRSGAEEWRVLPPAENQLGGWSWTWTGTRLVDPTPGGADGGQVNNYGRTIPYGGALDPATGTWSTLEDTPGEFTGGWSVDALGGRYSAVQGWIYDDGAPADGDGRGWARLDQPDGAPAEPGASVWAGDVLVVAGGADWDAADKPEEWTPESVWSTGAWAYRAD